jgi:hypothetical protein
MPAVTILAPFVKDTHNKVCILSDITVSSLAALGVHLTILWADILPLV